MSRLLCRPGVDDDIFDIAAFLADQSVEVASRFVDNVQITLKEIARRPGMGG